MDRTSARPVRVVGCCVTAFPGNGSKMTLSDARLTAVLSTTFGEATSTSPGPPPMTQITLWTCHAHYPGGSEQVQLRLLPCPCGLPAMQTGRHPRFTFEACSSFTRLEPVQLLTHLKWALSRGPSPDSYLSKPSVSYRVQPSVARVGPSPTGDLRLWGALHRN